MQKEISNISDILEYVESSKDSYECKLSNGLALKKRGSVIFKKSDSETVTSVCVKKLSGNGEFNVGETAYTSTGSDVNYSLNGLDTMERPLSAVGAISIVKLIVEDVSVVEKQSVEEVVSESVKEVVKEDVKEDVKEVVEPVKEDVKEEVVKEEVVKEVVEPVKEVVKEDIKEVVSEPVKEVEVVIPKPLKCIYNGKVSKFATLVRKKGNYQVLTSKNDKMVLIMSSSEVQIPIVIDEDMNTVKISFTAKSLSRAASLEIGIRGKQIELFNIPLTTKSNTYTVTLKVDESFKQDSQLLVITSRIDSVMITDLIVVS